MQAITFAIISYFTWGIGMVFEAVAAKKLQPYSLIFWGSFIGLIISSVGVPFNFFQLQNFSAGILLLMIVLSSFLVFGTLMYYRGIQSGNPAIVGTISASFPLVVVIISIIFLGEKPSANQSLAIILTLLGLLLSTVDFTKIKDKKFFKDKSVIYGLMTMIFWGIALAFVKIPIEKLGWFWPNYIFLAFGSLIFFYLKIRKIKLQKPTVNNAFLPLFISVVLVRIAEFSYNFAISNELVSVVAPISGASPTLFAPIAFFVFKDKITKQQILGIAVTLIGIVLLSIFSA